MIHHWSPCFFCPRSWSDHASPEAELGLTTVDIPMISVTKGDTVRIRDLLKSLESSARVMVAVDEVIITADESFFIEQFDAEGWNPSKTRRIVGKG